MARKRNQYGRLELRGQVWSVRWREYYEEEGKKKSRLRRETLGTTNEIPTRRAAERERDRLLRDINKANYTPQKICSFEHFALYWIDVVITKLNKKPSHVYNSRKIVENHLIPRFGGSQIHLITRKDVQEFVASMNGLSPYTIRNRLAPLKQVFSYAEILGGYIEENPTTNILLPETEEEEARVFTHSEVQSIIKVSAEPERTIYWLAAETGMRAGELFAFSVSNLLLDRCIEVEDGREIVFSPAVRIAQSVWRGRIVKTKSKRVRTVETSSALANHLKRYLEAHWKPNEMNLLFPSRKGTPIGYSNFLRRKFHKILEQLGIEKAGLHAFRHYSETRMDSLSIPMKVRQERLGHSDLSMVERYSHVVSEDSRRAAERLNPIDPNLELDGKPPAMQSTLVQ